MYGSTQDQAEYASAQSDMKHINDAISVYRAQRGTYPGTTTTYQNAATSLTQLVSEGYLDSASVLTASPDFSYYYRTDTARANYSLIRVLGSDLGACAQYPAPALPKVEADGNKLVKTTGTCAGSAHEPLAWGYWSPGAASW